MDVINQSKETLTKEVDTTKADRFNLSIIKCQPTKVPMGSWEHAESKIPLIETWYHHYKNGKFFDGFYIGIVCGKISGNLEVIDIDTKNDPFNTIWDELVALIPQPLYDRLMIQQTPSGGYHLIYRCPDAVIEKSLKLARHTDKAVILETRGEGGFICTDLRAYKLIQGKLDLLELEEDIPVITPEERTFLLTACRSLERYKGSPITYGEATNGGKTI